MAEGYEAFDGGRADRDGRERAGIALVSRFIGAVFLVLLGGLLLLDRSLLRANENQRTLDAESSALLVESYIDGQAAIVGQIADAMGSVPPPASKIAVHGRMARLVRNISGLRYAWSVGDGGLESVGSDPDSVVHRLSEQHIGLTPGGLTIALVRRQNGRALIVLTQRDESGAGGSSARVTGVAIETSPVESLLKRIQPGGRISVAVTSGNDTIAFVGRLRTTAATMPIAQRVIRLPTGGTWTATVVHAMTTRSLRWALWAVGVTGVLFLALGLLREQRRVIDAASRSLELERLYRDVKRANQAKSEFLANVSHELRTPLNAIVGFVELLREGFYGDLSPRQVLPVDRIAASATHLRHLVDQVLDIAKIAAGRLEVHSETIVLRPFVLNTASELESLVSEKGLVFSISVGASLPRVRTDPTHLRQILINLIGNAVKYTPAGTISVRARLVESPEPAAPKKASQARPGNAMNQSSLRPPRNGAWIALQVVDTGVGIGSADLERIFDEFEQVNAGPRGDSMQRGTGLGLAISRRLARLLGGEVGVESTIGQGSTFTIWLPVNAADLSAENTRSTPPNASVISA